MTKTSNQMAILVAILAVSLPFGARSDTANYDNDPLFHDLGGRDGVDNIAKFTVAQFLADARIKAIFDNTNMVRLQRLLSEQFCVVAGGPCLYTGRSMHATHKALGLTNANFNAVVEDLEAAMTQAGVPYRVQSRFLARLAPMHRDIVTK